MALCGRAGPAGASWAGFHKPRLAPSRACRDDPAERVPRL